MQTNVAKRAVEPDYDTQWRHRPAALGLNERSAAGRETAISGEGLPKIGVHWDQPATAVLGRNIAQLSYLRAGDFHVAVVDSQTSVWPELQPCSAVDSDSRVRFTLRASSPISKLGQ